MRTRVCLSSERFRMLAPFPLPAQRAVNKGYTVTARLRNREVHNHPALAPQGQVVGG